MTQSDFDIYDMQAMLSRSVEIQDPNDPTRWIADPSWRTKTREIFFNLFEFFQANGLVRHKLVEAINDVDGVVLRYSDLTLDGQQFVKARADERWLASFDRPGTKRSPSDVSYLEKQLAKLRAGKPNS